MDQTAFDYLKRILTARVYDVAVETELAPAPALSERLGNTLHLKREDTQSVFSFKLRGAYNKMSGLTRAQLDQGVICASAGNHAQGVALCAAKLGCRAVVVMPTTTPPVKVDGVRGRGAEVVLHGDSFSDAYAHALELERAQGLTFVHPFDDPDVIAGQGTIAMEILRQHSGPIHAIFCAIGGGGLIAGVAAYVKALRPEIRVIGVQAADSDAMKRSIEAGQRVTLPDVGLFSDGTAVKRVGEETFRLARMYVDEIITVDTDQVCAAIKDVFQDTRAIVEPAGALAVAGAKAYVERAAQAGAPLRGEHLVAVTCGANMNFDRLRFVAERAEVGERREALLAVSIPEQPGSLRRFCELIGARSVTEFVYRMREGGRAHVLAGLQIARGGEAAALARHFAEHGYEARDLSQDELAKLHLRHLAGGQSAPARGERLFRFEFPERPGALLRFLTRMAPDWNISLFHYRNQGGDVGQVLAGLQVPPGDEAAFQAFLDSGDCRHWEETDNPAHRLFL
ncbi:threonine ammonia-lyase, biosynthetic [Pseudoduganella namucuonensis]|uniref:L-threonine dehydratase n=1 Tax=Pseudoduganella namucuonensis TaxID=1035707 RepID=A0A1I7LXT5_9BURK|nr:threonine ammonia-lyase, biosynthetic [Pseudoduganella namucuonensis]SFV14410.1 threonine dehydratase [Pseudoduganella namucuonensis]